MMDMIQRMKQNRALVKGRKKIFDKKKRLHDTPEIGQRFKNSLPLGRNDNTTPEDLKRARAMAEKQQRTSAILFIACLLVLTCLVIYLVN